MNPTTPVTPTAPTTPAAKAVSEDFWATNVGKTLKVAGYVGGSSALAYIISATLRNPALFGPATILINMAAALIKHTWFDPSTPNLKLS